ncbi:intraflagellar transport protein 46 homolog isoform X2 [Dreissena polymorpha]|uniref:intraflagellar transport protein 46 homolog isoform X2 n=1 Tax=Dreissena polymorpha TaxID=45954 RepID=UPI00226442EC|nr:intraflagellar transport protein 46 homolog isoform X2 [Dreissena polymorpha]
MCKARVHQNQPYDESLEVPDGEEVASTYSPTPRVTQTGARLGVPARGRPQGPGRSRGSTPPEARMSENSDDEYDDKINPPDQQYAKQMRLQHQQEADMYGNDVIDDDDDDNDEDDDEDSLDDQRMPPQQQLQQQQQQQQVRPPASGEVKGSMRKPEPAPRIGQQGQQGQFNSEEEDEDDEDDESGSDDSEDDDDDDEDDEHVTLEGAYDPADYENLPVTPEIKELFQYITRYTPQSIELEHKLKPFIPDFIPSVGDIDAFIKISRPDQKPDTLGLTVMDEPCAKQSDPVVLDLQLRAISKQTTDKKLVVKSLSQADKNPKQIESWIESIRELHRVKPPPNVHYLKNMPDIDTLMQEWPPEFEELLKEVGLPTAELDCDLGEYVELICTILDIPIYKNTNQHNEKVQALHVLFTLFSEFKNSQHFKSLAEDNKMDNGLKGDFEDQGPDRFVL